MNNYKMLSHFRSSDREERREKSTSSIKPGFWVLFLTPLSSFHFPRLKGASG